MNQVLDVTVTPSVSNWALLEWNGGAESAELENITVGHINAASNLIFI